MPETYDPLPKIPDDCRCGGGFPPCPTGGGAYNTWLPKWMLAKVKAEGGQNFVVDSRTQRCLDAVLAYDEAMSPEKIIYRGLPQKYIDLENRWTDAEERSRLLAEMARLSPEELLERFSSPHMDEHDNLRLWAGRFKAYLDAIEQIALYNLVPEPRKGTAADVFYDRF